MKMSQADITNEALLILIKVIWNTKSKMILMYQKPLFIEPWHVWKKSCENSQSYLECVETKQIFFKYNYTKVSQNKESSYVLISKKGNWYFCNTRKCFHPLCDRNIFTTAKHLHSTFFVWYTLLLVIEKIILTKLWSKNKVHV